MTYDEFRKTLSPSLKGSFVLFGDEDYLKRDALERARQAVIADPSMREFCHTVIHDGDIAAAEAELSLPSMLGGDRLIELHGLEPEKMKENDFSALCEIMAQDNVLFVVYIEAGRLSEYQYAPKKSEKKGADKKGEKEEKADTRSRFVRLSETATLVECKRQDRSRLTKWILRHFEVSGLNADTQAADALLSLVSFDMFILKNEIDKLIAFAKSKGSDRVTERTVRYVCSSYTEIGAFDFANAILARNKRRAFDILSDMKKRKEPAQVVLAQVAKVSSELLSVKTLAESGMNLSEMGKALKMKDYPLRLRLDCVKSRSFAEISAMCKRCHSADVALKSSPIEPYIVLEELILAI